MVRVVIAYPINVPTKHQMNAIVPQRISTKPGVATSSHYLTGLISDRRFKEMGNVDLTERNVSWPHAGHVELFRVQVFSGEQFASCVCYFEIEDDYVLKTIDDLRRFSTSSIQSALKALEFEPAPIGQIRATTASLNFHDACAARDGWVKVQSNMEGYLFDQTWGHLVALVCTERMLLDEVTQFIARGDKSHRKSARFMRELIQWRSIPGSDSTPLHIDLEDLRNSLRLGARYDQILEILREDARLFERRWNVSSLASGLTLSTGATLLSSFPRFNVGQLIGASTFVFLGLQIFVGRIKR